MKKILFSIFILAFCNPLSYTQDFENISIDRLSVMINIDIKSLYTPTGIHLEVGDSVLIFADGIASPWIGYEWFGPEGMGYHIASDEYPLPDLPEFSLMGKIGEDGTPFYVGSSFGFSSNVSGEFFLGVNDHPLSDNIGYWIAWIICTSCSESTTAINEIKPKSKIFSLNQNYPNPFTESTTVSYILPQPLTVQLTIYNHLGKQVDIIQKKQSSGKQQIIWKAEGQPAGMYHFELKVGDQLSAGKMVLVR